MCVCVCVCVCVCMFITFLWPFFTFLLHFVNILEISYRFQESLQAMAEQSKWNLILFKSVRGGFFCFFFFNPTKADLFHNSEVCLETKIILSKSSISISMQQEPGSRRMTIADIAEIVEVNIVYYLKTWGLRELGVTLIFFLLSFVFIHLLFYLYPPSAYTDKQGTKSRVLCLRSTGNGGQCDNQRSDGQSSVLVIYPLWKVVVMHDKD